MAKQEQLERSVGEQLSSAVDGELENESSRFLLRRLESDTELNSRWHRFQVIGDCMRGQYAGRSAMQLRTRIAAQIADEPLPALNDHSATQSQRRFLRPMAGIAVAASVAVVAVMGLRNQAPTQEETQPLAVPTASISADTVQPAAAATRRSNIDARLSRYLVRHNEMAPEGGRSGFVSYAHMVSTGAGQRAAGRSEGKDTAPLTPVGPDEDAGAGVNLESDKNEEALRQ